MGYDDDVNLYAYVKNDPINQTDPTGTVCTGAISDPKCKADYFNGRKIDEARAAGLVSKSMEKKIGRYEKSAEAGYAKALQKGDNAIKVAAFPNAPQKEVTGNQIAQKMQTTKINIETRPDYQSSESAGGYGGVYLFLSSSQGVDSNVYVGGAMSATLGGLNLPEGPKWDRIQAEIALHEMLHQFPALGSNNDYHQEAFRKALEGILGP